MNEPIHKSSADANPGHGDLFASVFEHAGGGLAVTTPDGKFLRVNRALCELLGLPEAELLAASLEQVIHPDDLTRHREGCSCLVAGSIPAAHEEFRCRHKNGNMIRVAVSTALVRDAVGQPKYLISQFQDITRFQQSVEQAQQTQKMAAISRLAGGMAHDFNNILAVILGYANLIGSELPPGNAQTDNLDQIIQSAERAAILTRQLLTLSRRQTVAPVPVNLNALVANAQKVIARQLGKGIELVAITEPNLGNVKAEPVELELVILNLAANARDAMPAGGRLTITTENVTLPATCEWSGLPAGEYVTLTVTDTGVGISAEVKAHLYEPYFTTKEVGKGAGLGLSTVYGIVQQHHGAIQCISEPGQGTTFRVILPRVKEAPAPTAFGGANHLAARGGETILVVEDEESLRGLAKIVLEKHGYEVLTAFDGVHALEVCQEFKRPIHLLLTDVVMPRMDGTELAKRITEFQPAITTLYSSGFTDNVLVPGDTEKAFLQKPYTPVKLLERVRELLDQRRKI